MSSDRPSPSTPRLERLKALGKVKQATPGKSKEMAFGSVIDGSEFILQLSEMLKLPQETKSTALVYRHRYHTHYDQINTSTNAVDDYMFAQEYQKTKMDDLLLGCACVTLACKVTEQVRKIRDVLNCAWWIAHPDLDPEGNVAYEEEDKKELVVGPDGMAIHEITSRHLPINNHYHHLRESLVQAELILLRVLGFQMDVHLCYRWIANSLHKAWVALWKDVIDEPAKRELDSKTLKKFEKVETWQDLEDCFRSSRDRERDFKRDMSRDSKRDRSRDSKRDDSKRDRSRDRRTPRNLYEVAHEIYSTLSQIAQLAYAHANDAYFVGLPITHQRNFLPNLISNEEKDHSLENAKVLAAACVYLALRQIGTLKPTESRQTWLKGQLQDDLPSWVQTYFGLQEQRPSSQVSNTPASPSFTNSVAPTIIPMIPAERVRYCIGDIVRLYETEPVQLPTSSAQKLLF